MMSRACLALLAGALLGACELASAPPPSILAVEPAEVVVTDQRVELRLHIDALLPGTMDYGSRSVSGEALASVVQVWVGEQPAEVQRYEPGGILIVLVPADVAEGVHDVRLVLSDGREARRAQGGVETRAFSGDILIGGPDEPGGPEEPTEPEGPVEQVADGGTPSPDAGLRQERAGLSGFRIEPVKEQVRGVPFVLEVQAEGSEAASFQGTVTLSVDNGTIEPAVAGPFKNGSVRVEGVTVSQPGAKRVITVTDTHGNEGRSNEFRVQPN